MGGAKDAHGSPMRHKDDLLCLDPLAKVLALLFLSGGVGDGIDFDGAAKQRCELACGSLASGDVRAGQQGKPDGGDAGQRGSGLFRRIVVALGSRGLENSANAKSLFGIQLREVETTEVGHRRGVARPQFAVSGLASREAIVAELSNEGRPGGLIGDGVPGSDFEQAGLDF